MATKQQLASEASLRALTDAIHERVEQTKRWPVEHDDAHSLDHLLMLIQQRLSTLTHTINPDFKGRVLVEVAALSLAALEHHYRAYPEV